MKENFFILYEWLSLRIEEHVCHPGPWASWYAAWADMFKSLVVLATFGRVYPNWEVTFRAWQGRTYLRRKLLGTYLL